MKIGERTDFPFRLPEFPGGKSLVPHLIEKGELGEVVHGLPESVVPIGHEFPVAGEGVHRLALEHLLARAAEVSEEGRAGDKKSAVDEAGLGLRLFREVGDTTPAIHLQFPIDTALAP